VQGRPPKRETEQEDWNESHPGLPVDCRYFVAGGVAEATARRTAGSCALVTITSLGAQIDSLANSLAEPQIAAGREPQTMGLNLWSNVTLCLGPAAANIETAPEGRYPS
jgi:hypothetical protein